MRVVTLFLMVLFLIFPLSQGENITVALEPREVEVYVGETFKLDLVVKNVPEEGKCGGFEAE
ncbi:MAG TPA: hypothetical protein EYH55_05020, partial [Methanothermococcus okinawensis]|nr:hypothetical protein [Methanothermococcus okinawensis]